MTKGTSVLKTIAINVLLFVILMIFLEGLLGWLFVIKDIFAYQPLAERQHTRYDPMLGWRAAENVFIPDMYGPGEFVRTNSAGFRNVADFTASVPEGMSRLVCSGNSFTFGYGVSNDEAWCVRVAALVPRLESVNMGMGGYGIDQSLLWYEDVQESLEHDLHIMAFIHDDFMRIEKDDFFGYGKPRLELVNGELVTRNVPVPEASFARAELYLRFRPLQRLRTARFARELAVRLRGKQRKGTFAIFERAESPELAVAIVKKMHELSVSRGRRFLAVYLPIMDDFETNEADPWRKHLAAALEREGVPFLDLIPELRALPPSEIPSLYISEEESAAFRNASLHYTAKGNQLIATRIAAWVRNAVEQRYEPARTPSAA